MINAASMPPCLHARSVVRPSLCHFVVSLAAGILPACSGQLTLLLQRSFWRQNFVFYAIMAEFSLGLHDLMLSGCSYNSERNLEQAQRVLHSSYP